MSFEDLRQRITREQGRAIIGSDTLRQLFGVDVAHFFLGALSALEIQAAPTEDDGARFMVRGTAAVACLHPSEHRQATACFEATRVGGAGEPAVRATLRVECPEGWRLDDSFPDRPRFDDNEEALVDALAFHGAFFTASNCDSDTLKTGLNFAAEWTPHATLGMLADVVAGQPTVPILGQVVLPSAE
jgi:hypothetical protein